MCSTLNALSPPICIDGRMLNDGGAGTGVGQYARTVLTALQDVGICPAILEAGAPEAYRSRNTKLLAAARPWTRKATSSSQGFYARDIFREAQVFFNIYKRPMAIQMPGPPGIMHWTYPLPMAITGWRNLYTVHDVMPLDPDIPSPVHGPRLRAMLDALHALDGDFVTVSASARLQILAHMGWTAERITTCHQGVDVTGVKQGLLPAGLKPREYFLYVGAVEARKNLTALLDAYRMSGIKLPLVISGPDGMDAASIDRQVLASPGAMRLGLQDRGTVLQLIANARALVLVSLAEGFGIPVAEAMALGTPVLSADIPALAEVGAGATLLVNPQDRAHIRDGLIALDKDDALRVMLVARGLQRSGYFALQPYSQRLLKLYGMA